MHRHLQLHSARNHPGGYAIKQHIPHLQYARCTFVCQVQYSMCMLVALCVLIGLTLDSFAKSGHFKFRLGLALHIKHVAQMFKVRVNGTDMDVSVGISQGQKYCMCVRLH